METKLLRGRGLDSRDTANSPRVAVINELLAAKLFGKHDPIGRRFRLDSADGPELQVVGLAKQGIYTYWAEPALEAVWTPYAQDFSSQMYIEMRTAADASAFAALVREQVRALDPGMPVFRISTMASFFHDRAMLGPRLIAQIVTATGVMGLFMAVIGLYGVVAYAVSRRTREIGIRLAIGATPAGVMRLVLNQGAVFTAVGLAIGMALVIPIARTVVPNFVVGTNPLGAIVLLGVPALLAAATMAACWIPCPAGCQGEPDAGAPPGLGDRRSNRPSTIYLEINETLRIKFANEETTMSPSTRTTRLLAAAQLALFFGSLPPANAAGRPLESEERKSSRFFERTNRRRIAWRL